MGIVLFIFICYPELARNLLGLSPRKIWQHVVSGRCFAAENMHSKSNYLPSSLVLSSEVDCLPGVWLGTPSIPGFFHDSPTMHTHPSLHRRVSLHRPADVPPCPKDLRASLQKCAASSGSHCVSLCRPRFSFVSKVPLFPNYPQLVWYICVVMDTPLCLTCT